MNEFVRDSIRVIRNVLGYTQAEFADILGIERAVLGNLEQQKIELKKTIGIAYITVVFMEYDRLRLLTDEIQVQILQLYIDQFKEALLEAITIEKKVH